MEPVIEIVDESGVTRHLGNVPGPVRFAWAEYGSTDKAPMVPRSEWKTHALGGEAVRGQFLSPVHDQNGYGMCNASATASAMESQRAKQGLPPVRLSAGHLYGRINGGRDQGSLLEDGLREAMANGVPPVDDCPYLDWRTRSAAAAAAAKRFRVLEAFVCPTFEHCASAVICGFDLISGIMWYSNYTPDADGWLPAGRGSGGGHAVHGFALAERGGRFGIWHKNSWRPSWGLNGFCVFPEQAYSGPVGGWWAVRSMVDEGGVVPSER